MNGSPDFVVDRIGVGFAHPEWGVLFLVAAFVLMLVGARGAPRSSSLATTVVAALVVLALTGPSIHRQEPSTALCVGWLEDPFLPPAARDAARDLERRLRDGLRPDDRLAAVAQLVEETEAASSWSLADGFDAALGACDRDPTRLVAAVDTGRASGDLARVLQTARDTGSRVYPLRVGEAAGALVTLDKLMVPRSVREGETFPVRGVVRNVSGEPRTVRVRSAVDGRPTQARVVQLPEGLSAVEIPHRISRSGGYEISMTLDVDRDGDGEAPAAPSLRVAGRPGASTRSESVSVMEAWRVAIVSDARDSPIATVLRPRGFEVGVHSPADWRLDSLLRHHAVILDDVEAGMLPPGALALLERYVDEWGGGLVLTGGRRLFGDLAYGEPPLGPILPVRFVEQEPPPTGRAAMGVFLLIDRSNSMGYRGTSRKIVDLAKMRYAVTAARALLDQLHPEDHVGIVAFDSNPYVLAPLGKLSAQRESIETRLDALTPGGGTDFKGALELAADQLVSSNLSVRHVLLLTDGDTNRATEDHDRTIRNLRNLGISATTLRIGDDDANLALLRRISEATGGRFYHVPDLERLPQLLVREATELDELDDESARRGWIPQVRDRTAVLEGFFDDDFPLLGEAVSSAVRPGARTMLAIRLPDGERPLLAGWQRGLGRVATFSLDPTGRGAERWIGWDGFGKLWAQLVRWLGGAGVRREFRTAIRWDGDVPLMELLVVGVEDEETLELFVDGETLGRPVRLSRERYEMPLRGVPAGKHELAVAFHVGERLVTRKSRDVHVPEPPSARPVGLAGLDRLARETGGAWLGDLEPVLDRGTRWRWVAHPVDWIVWLFAAALFPWSVALRLRGE